MFSKFVNFITNIRNADEPVRRRWLVILGGVATVIVVFLWAVFFNLNLPQSDDYAAASEPIVDDQNSIMTKLAEIKTTLGNGLLAVGEKLGIKNRFTVRTDSRNFILEGLEPVSPPDWP